MDRRTLTDDDVRRRIEFLIGEARQPTPIRDRSVTFTMRTISNYYCVKRDCDSNYLKKKSQRRSAAAHAKHLELFKSQPREWLKQVTNEHQEPLDQIWKWMCDSKQTLTAATVIDRFKAWPVVIVTIEENGRLRRLEFSKPQLSPSDRYREAGIEVLGLQDDGEWRPVSGADAP